MNSGSTFMRIGRIILGLGCGVLVSNIAFGEDPIRLFEFALPAIAIGIVFITYANNHMKLKGITLSNTVANGKVCPNCGLNLTPECNQCPKCYTYQQY